MAQLISVKLSRFDACPWGFRLQGGKDFGAPLVIQKVNGGSPAEKAGLQAGDAVFRVNDVELFNLRHKEAQDYIVKAGNNFELTVQRGGSTWKPQVTPVGPAPVNFSPASNVQPITKTSLSAKKQDVPHIGAGHNFAPKPYSGPQVNGIGDPTVKSIVNKQYNTPVGIYSEETIAETLSAQAEVLAGGVLGVNFKKNEKIYNAANSEVLKMVQEIDSEPKEPEPALSSSTSFFATSSHAVGGRATSPRPLTPLAQQLPAPSAPSSYLPTNVPLDTPKCSDCERGIVGVFVRIKDKNLHVECFKCATCGTSLKNVGYYNINNKLYCDIHAKLVARQNPPAPNLEPVTVPPGSRVPAGTISAALSKAPVSSASNFAPASTWAPAPTYAPAPAPAPVSPGNLSPQPGTLGPLPFHAPSSLAGPKPFSTPSAPITSSSRPAPACSKFVWPPSRSEEETSSPTATPLYIPPNPYQEASISLTPSGRPAPRLPLSSVKSTSAPAPVISPAAQNRAASCPSPLTSALTIAPERPYSPLSGIAPAPTDIPLPSQAITSVPTQQTAPFPQPFSVYLSKHQSPLRTISSPAPLQQGHSQPPDELPPLQPALQNFSCEENAISIEDPQAEDLNAVQNSGLHKKFSLCSQEVFAINADKSAPKFETLSETLQAQILVSSLTPDPVKRPESPVPMQDNKTYSFQDLPLTTEEDTSKEANHNSVPDEQAKAVAAESTTLEATNPVSELVSPPADRELSVLSEIQSIAVPESAQPTGITNIETTDIEAKEDSSASQSDYINVTDQSVLSQQGSLQVSEGKSSSHLIVDTQEVQSQFVSTSTVSDGSFYPLPISTVPSQSEVISKCEQNINSQSHTIPSQAVSGFVPVSWEQEYSAAQFQEQTRQISSQQSSSLISESIQPLKIFANTPPTNQPFPSQAQDHSTDNLSPMSSALTAVSDPSYSPLPAVTKAVAPVLMQSAPAGTQASYPAVVKCVASGSLSVSVQAPQNDEAACPSSLLSALTVAPDRPYSPLPSATKAVAQFPVQSTPVSTQAVRPVVPVPLPAGIEVPLARGAAYPSVAKVAPLLASTQVLQPSSSIPAPLQTNIQGPSSPEGICSSPLTLALTIAPDRPYSPLSILTRPPDCVPLQMTVKPTTAPVPASVKFSPSEQLLRDETQFPLLSVPSHKVAETSKPEPVSNKITPKQRPVSSGLLPVIGAFRPIIPATEFKPITSEVVLDKEQHSSYPPVSYELNTECAVSPAARPKTPVQRIATPTSRSHSGTPFQQQKYTTTGLQKPAIIPIYQQQMGEFPGQRPRSATPTCPLTVPRVQTPQPQFTTPEVPYAPQKPSASFQRQLPPHKPYASYQPAAPAAGVQPEPLIQQSLMPFPNIPLPEDTKTESLDIASRPVKIPPPQPFSAPQHLPLGPSPLSTIQPVPLCPVSIPPPPAAPQPMPSALVVKPSPLSASQSKPAAPEPSISATMPIVPKTAPVLATQPISIANTPSAPSSSSVPNAGGGGIGVPGGVQKGASIAGSTAPHRGRGVLTQQSSIAGGRIPLCAHCSSQIRGPFITALGKNWCPDHFVCVNAQCRRPLADIGFVEEKGELYCEYCFEKYLAPTCDKCSTKVKGDCLNAIGKHFHPECFLCAYCGKLFGNNPFFLEDGLAYCETDWNELFTTKCFACGFPIEAGDRWVEALSNNYHSQCFNCTNCKKNLEGQSFYAKGGRPFCKAHAR